MNRSYTYCPICSVRLETVREKDRERARCPGCGFIHYMNPVCAVGVVIVENGNVLLVRRRYNPYKGLWAIPSGFVEYDEDLRTSALRETKEETGLDVSLEGLLAAESCFDDPRGNSVLVLFRGSKIGGSLEPGDDAEEARFFPLEALPALAFESHRKVLSELTRSGKAPL